MFTFWLSARFLGLKTRGLRLEPARVWEGDLVVIRLNRPKKKKKRKISSLFCIVLPHLEKLDSWRVGMVNFWLLARNQKVPKLILCRCRKHINNRFATRCTSANNAWRLDA